MMTTTRLVQTQLDAPDLERGDYDGRLTVLTTARSRVTDTFADDVRAGLSRRQKSLPAKYLYDKTGSRLFEEICEQPEYYLTRTEEGILSTHAAGIADAAGDASAMTELGAGSSAKTRHLIDRFVDKGKELTYNPIDISEEMIRMGARRLLGEYPELRVFAMVCEYEVGLAELKRLVPQQKVIVFLGSSFGNFTHDEGVVFLKSISNAMSDDDCFLIGIDMAKDPQIIHKAYDDAKGVTERFNKNVLARINRRFKADFDLNAFGHVARYEQEKGRVEMHLVSRENQTVTIGELDMTVSFKVGESIHTENSHKFTPEVFESICRRATLQPDRHWSDENDWFRLVLLKRTAA